MADRITINIASSGVLEIWLNEEGRNLQVRELQALNQNNDRFHLMPGDVPSDIELSTRAYRPTSGDVGHSRIERGVHAGSCAGPTGGRRASQALRRQAEMVAAAKPAAIAGPTIISSGDHGEPALSIRAKEEIEQGQGASRGVRFTP